MPRKWRNGAAPSVDKIKSDDKTPSFPRFEGAREWGGCVTVVCRVTRVITVARLLARTPSQKTERTLHFCTAVLARISITRQVPTAIRISQRTRFTFLYFALLHRLSPTDNPRFPVWLSNQLALSFMGMFKNFHDLIYYREMSGFD